MIDNSTLRKFGTSAKIYIIYSVLLLILCSCASNTNQKIDPESVNIDKLYSPIELQDDFEFLFQTMEEIHPNLYLYTDKSIIDSLRNDALIKFNRSMTSMDFWKLVTPIVTKLGDGHTNISFPYGFRKKYLDNGGKIIPLNISIEDSGVSVKSNYSSDSTLSINTKILSINKIPLELILNELHQYKSGEMESFINKQIERSFKPLIWAHYGFEGPFVIEYISSLDEQHYTQSFPGVTIEEYDSISTKQNKSETKYKPWTFHLLPEENTGVIDLNSFSDKKGFKKFFKTTFREIKDKEIKNLIIDIRDNGGGENSVGELLVDYIALHPWVLISKAEVRMNKELLSDIPWFVRWLPKKPAIRIAGWLNHYTNIASIEELKTEQGVVIYTIYTKPKKQKRNPIRFKGNTYVLINGGSYSMSVMFAAIIKDHRFGTLIGEETGQPANPYGANYFIRLPNTQLPISVAAAKAFRPSGKEDGHGVIPDYEVKQTSEDRAKGIDTIMEFTKQLILNNETAKN